MHAWRAEGEQGGSTCLVGGQEGEAEGVHAWGAGKGSREGVHAWGVGLARFIDASIYRDTFPAILFFTITIFFFFFFFAHNDFNLDRKDT